MGQDISVLVKAVSDEKKLSFSKEGRAKYSFINSGVELRQFIEEIFEDFFKAIGVDGLMYSTSSRDFEDSYRVFAQLGHDSKNDSVSFDGYGNYTKFSQYNPDWFTPFEVVADSYLKFIGINKSDSHAIYFDYDGLDENEITQFIAIAFEALEGEFRSVYILHNDEILGYDGENVHKIEPNSLDTSTLEYLGFKFPLKALEIPQEIQMLLSTKAYRIGNKPDGRTYFGVGQTTVATVESNEFNNSVQYGKFAMWEKNGEKFLYFDKSLAEKIAVGLTTGFISLDEYTFTETNLLYNEAYEKWLKDNDYGRLSGGRGIGNKTIHWFRFGYK